MAKPSVTLRNTKASALTYNELDTNFTNLRDATISVTDGSNTADIDLNGTLNVSAGTGISVSVTPGTDTLTITNTGAAGTVTNPLTSDLDTNNFVLENTAGQLTLQSDDGWRLQSETYSAYNYLDITFVGTLDTDGTVIKIEPSADSNIDIQNASGSAILDIDTTGTITLNSAYTNIKQVSGTGGGVVWLTGGTAPGSPSNGMIYYDSSTNKFRGYANGAWVDLH